MWLNVVSTNAQLSEFQGFVSEQVLLGNWMEVEGELILNYIDRNGLPIIPEEVSAIPGLTASTRQELYHSRAWSRLCIGRESNELKKRQGPSGELRTEAKEGRVRTSVRFKNPGKWALRWDRLSTDEPRVRGISGYLLMRPVQNVELLIGTHKVGWANRLALSEAVFFSGLTSPAFAVPVQYAFVPMWGFAETGVRRGIACKVERGKWEGCVSGDRLLDNARWAATIRRRLLRGAAGFVLERGWVIRSPSATAVDSWVGSVFASGNRGGWQWAVEYAPALQSHSFDATWLKSIGRVWDGFGSISKRNGWVSDHDKMERRQRNDLEASLGMEWKSSDGRWTSRFLMEIEPLDAAVDASVRSSIVFDGKENYRLEWHGKWQFESAVIDANSMPDRVGFRWQFGGDAITGNFRLEWCPHLNDHGLGWSFMWGTAIGACDLKLSIADWSMGTQQTGYFVAPAFDGIRIQAMRQEGSKVSLRLCHEIKDHWEVQILGSKGNSNDREDENWGLSTSRYAQSEIQFRLMLNL